MEVMPSMCLVFLYDDIWFLSGTLQVSVQDSLPQQVCGPCVAKLDEVVDFVDSSHTTQSKLKSQLKGKGKDMSLRIVPCKTHVVLIVWIGMSM